MGSPASNFHKSSNVDSVHHQRDKNFTRPFNKIEINSIPLAEGYVSQSDVSKHVGQMGSRVSARIREYHDIFENGLDRNKKSPTLVGDLVSNIHDLEKLVALLEEALARAKHPNAKAESCMKFVRDGFAEIMNPNLAFELELAQFVEAKRPPNGEFYRSRADKTELAVAFFHRVYGKFHAAGVLYRHQLLVLDSALVNALGNYKDEVKLKTKTDFINDAADAILHQVGNVSKVVLALNRRQYG